MYSLAYGENASWRSAGGDDDGGIRLMNPSSAENVVAVCPIFELICKGWPDICTQDIIGLGIWSCCSELWIQYDLLCFTTRHTTTSSP